VPLQEVLQQDADLLVVVDDQYVRIGFHSDIPEAAIAAELRRHNRLPREG